jgi:hypothetical protein
MIFRYFNIYKNFVLKTLNILFIEKAKIVIEILKRVFNKKIISLKLNKTCTKIS